MNNKKAKEIRTVSKNIAARVLLVYCVIQCAMLLTFNALFVTDPLRAPSAHLTSHKVEESISSIQEYGTGNPSNEVSLYTSMNAQVDSLGSVSTPLRFPSSSIGTITNCHVEVKNEFHGDVKFVYVYGQNNKQDTDKD